MCIVLKFGHVTRQTQLHVFISQATLSERCFWCVCPGDSHFRTITHIQNSKRYLLYDRQKLQKSTMAWFPPLKYLNTQEWRKIASFRKENNGVKIHTEQSIGYNVVSGEIGEEERAQHIWFCAVMCLLFFKNRCSPDGRFDIHYAWTNLKHACPSVPVWLVLALVNKLSFSKPFYYHFPPHICYAIYVVCYSHPEHFPCFNHYKK